MEYVKAKVVEKTPCIHLVFDARNEGYCHACIKDKSFFCEHADYNAKSYFPPCVKHWFMDKGEEENVKLYNRDFRNK